MVLLVVWRWIYSTTFWLFVLFSSCLIFPFAVIIWAITHFFDHRKVVLHGFTCWWACLYMWLNPLWDVSVIGRENMKPGEAYVMIANHLSTLDILVLFRLFRHFKWVSKIENFSVPFIGWNMSLNNYIKVRRGDRSSVVQMLKACSEALSQGNSIMMFPEGTRSSTGKLRPFKSGAFEIALETRRPILPIIIRGTANALPKSGFVLQGRHKITIEVKPPVAPETFAHMSIDELTEMMRTFFAYELGDLGDATHVNAIHMNGGDKELKPTQSRSGKAATVKRE